MPELITDLCRPANPRNLPTAPAAALQSPRVAVRAGMDRPLWIDGLRIAPRHHHRVAVVLPGGSGCQCRRPDPLHHATGPQFPLDAPLLRSGSPSPGTGRSDPLGRQRGCLNGQLVDGRSDRILVPRPLRGMAGIRRVSQCRMWHLEWLDCSSKGAVRVVATLYADGVCTKID